MKGCPQHERGLSQGKKLASFTTPTFRAISIPAPFAGHGAGLPVFLLVSLLSLGWPAISLPAPQAASVSYEGHPVAEVVLAARPGINTESLQRLVLQKAGEPFSNEKIQATLVELQKTGQFTKVSLELTPVAAGLRLSFLLQPVFYLGMIRFPGAEKTFSYARLLQLCEFSPQEPYQESHLKKAQDNLVRFLEENGYFAAQIQAELQPDKTHELVNVDFRLTLNERARFGKTTIMGPPPPQALHLQGILLSSRAWLRGASIGPGQRYSKRRLEAARRYLKAHLGSQDQPANQVELQPPHYDRATNRADITFEVKLGPLVDVQISGARLSWWPFWGSRTERRLIPIYEEGSLDNDLIEEGTQNLASHFQSKGYFEVGVKETVQREPAKVTIVYEVEKGERDKVAEITVRGQRQFSADDLLSRVTLKKARWFSRGHFSQKALSQSLETLTAFYQAEGFENVEIQPQVTDRGSKTTVTLVIQEGPRTLVNSLQVKGNQRVTAQQLAATSLRLQAGHPYSPQRFNEDRNEMVAKYLDRGYLMAQIEATAQPHGGDPHSVDVVYDIHEGPCTRVSSVVDLGAQHTKLNVIKQALVLQAGEPLSQGKMLESESRLYKLGVFDWANIEPQRPITNQEEEDVLVKVHEGKRNRLSYGIGFEAARKGGNVPGGTVVLPGGFPVVGFPANFQTSEATIFGPRFSLDYSRLNLRGRGETASIGALVSRLDQRGLLTYSAPRFLGSPWNPLLSFSAERSTENPIFTERTGEGSLQVQRPLNADETKTLLFRYSYGRTVLTDLLIPDLVLPADRNVRLSGLSAAYVRDTRDKPLDAHRGIYQTVDLGFTSGALGASASFVRFLGQMAYYHPVSSSVVWANDVRLGFVKAFAGSRVPLSQRFFSGGADSLRGFPINGAGPQRPVPVCTNPNDTSTCTLISVPIGGNQLFIFNSELRFPTRLKKGLGAALFYDGGNVYDRIGFSRFFKDYSHNVGFGFRYDTPVGPIRIDIGHNLSPLPGVRTTQIYISLGQAF